MNKRRRVIVAALTAVVLSLGAGATAYAAHYQDRALPGTQVAGMDVGGQTKDEVAAALASRLAATTVTVNAEGKTQTTTLADAGYAVDVPRTVERVFGANSSWTAYPASLLRSRTVDPVVSVDRPTFDAYLAALSDQGGVKPANASVSLAEGASTFTVNPAVPGKAIDAKLVAAALDQAVKTLDKQTVTANLVEVDAAVSTQAAQALTDKANALAALPVTITEGSQSFIATPADVAVWVSLPALDAPDAKPLIHRGRLATWVNAQAASVTVEPRQGVRNISASGSVLAVATEAVDGKDITNVSEVVEGIGAALEGGTPYTGAFTAHVTPATWQERRIAAGAEGLAYPATEGEKWVDVNLSNYTMTAYEGGRVVIGPVAMVSGADLTPTVVGTFRIYSKTPSMTMRGFNYDGTPYVAEGVPWVAFFSGGYALHGAPWRSSFGFQGSHGCINLPTDVAQQVYGWAPIGTPVVTHY